MVILSLFPLIAGKIGGFRGVRLASDARVVLATVSKFGNGRRRDLITIISSVSLNIRLDNNVRRYDTGLGIDKFLITENPCNLVVLRKKPTFAG